MMMNDVTMRKLVDMRAELGFPFVLTSGYRCPQYNNRIAKTGLNGPHTTGQAVDIAVYGERALKVISNAWRYGFTGVGIDQSGPRDKRVIHLDDLMPPNHSPRPWVWSY
jgi:uncharacterized protein YcbK (DUF882 family)